MKTAVSMNILTFLRNCSFANGQDVMMGSRFPVYRFTHSSPILLNRMLLINSTKHAFIMEPIKLYSPSCPTCFAVSGVQVNSSMVRSYATAPNPKKDSRSKSLTQSSEESGAVTLSLGEKVKENAKTGGYGLVILAGIAVTGALMYVILSELFSSESPNNIYTHAFKLCKLSSEVNDALGSPIKCYGEESRRGWRRHVSHLEFHHQNTKYLRMRFFVEGPFKKGTVHLEKKQNERGKYEYTYIIVEVDGYPPRKIEVHF